MMISWIGMLLGVSGLVLGQVLEGGRLDLLLQPTAAIIVFGGTLGATMLSSTVVEFRLAMRAAPKAFWYRTPDFEPLIREIVSLALNARRNGLLSLERALDQINTPFLQTYLKHVVDGYDTNVLKEMMEERIRREEEERLAIARVWESAGGFSPTMGILGAVLGLIHVMTHIADATRLPSGIAVAFVATVYGVGGANLILLPVANKLKKITKQEIRELELMYVGILGIQNGINPRLIEDRLYNLLGTTAAPITPKAIDETRAAA